MAVMNNSTPAIIGSESSADDLRDALSFLDNWEDRYRFVIDLGKRLPQMPEERRTEDRLVRGCQSQVWLHVRQENDRMFFEVDSDAHIVRGLIAILMHVYNGRSAKEIREFDIDAYFADLDLLAHLSSARGNGLRAMVKTIQELASDPDAAN